MPFRLRWQWTLLLLIFAVFAGMHGLRSWRIGYEYPWARFGSDQTYIGSIYYGLYTPEFYARDWLFSQPEYYQFYTPSFLRLLSILEPIAGDVPRTFALLHAPLLLVYLVSAAVLFWRITRSDILAAIFALISAHGIESTVSAWTPTLFIRILPLSLVLPVVIWALISLLWALEKVQNRQAKTRHWVLTGALIGMAANIHPGTGIGLALFTGFLLLAHWYRTGKPWMQHIIILTITTMVFAAPIMLNVLPNIGKVVTNPLASDFETFTRIFATRGFVMPRQFLDAVRWPLAQFTVQTQILIGLSWLPVTLLLGWQSRANQRHWASLLFVATQLVYAWLMINPTTNMILYFVVFCFFLWRWYLRDEQQEMLYFGMLAAVSGVALFLTMVGWLAWYNLHIWSITNFVGEMPRAATLYTPVFCLIGLRGAWHSVQAAQKSLPLLVLFWVFSMMLIAGVLNPLNIWFVILLLALLFGGILHEYSPPGLWLVWWLLAAPLVLRALINTTWMQVFGVTLSATMVFALGLIGGGLFWLVQQRQKKAASAIEHKKLHPLSRFLYSYSYSALSLLLIGAALMLVYSQTVSAGFTPNFILEKLWQQVAEIRLPFAIAVCFGIVFLLLLLRPYASAILSQIALLCVGLVLAVTAVHVPLDEYLSPLSDGDREPLPLVQVALWAKEHTPSNALFYCSTSPALSESCFTFRFWGQRSITYDVRSLRMIEYARPAELAYWMATIDSAVNAAQRANTLLENARQLDVDYIILENRAAIVPLDLPVAYENQTYVVYAVGD